MKTPSSIKNEQPSLPSSTQSAASSAQSNKRSFRNSFSLKSFRRSSSSTNFANNNNNNTIEIQVNSKPNNMAKGSLDSMSSSYLPDHPGLASNDSNARIQASNSLRDLSSVKTATEPIPITPNQSLHGSRRPSLAKDLSPLTSAASDGVQSSSGEGLNLTGSSTETSSTIHSKNGPSTTASRITRSISKQNIFRSVNLRKKTSSEGVIADPILINTGPRRSTSALFNKSVTISNEDPYQHQHLQLQRHSVSNLLDVEGDNNNKNIINKNNIIFQVNPSTTKIIQSDSFGMCLSTIIIF